MSDDRYEAKISPLLANAYNRDVAPDSGMKEVWKEAYSKLNEGDHYIAVMLEPSLGRKLRKGWL
jgi:CRISPR/Cas system CSM-associated protein Csm2 small subunit